jgi:hypothetical protein
MLQTLANLGSFIGGIAVAATLAYLAVQVRQNSRAAQTNAAQTVMLSMSEYFRSVSESSELSRVITSAYADPNSLTDPETSQFFFWAFSYFRLIELAHYHHERGHIPDTFWNGQKAHLCGLLQVPAIARFWALRKGVFSKEFGSFIDALDLSTSAPVGARIIEGFRNGSAT